MDIVQPIIEEQTAAHESEAEPTVIVTEGYWKHSGKPLTLADLRDMLFEYGQQVDALYGELMELVDELPKGIAGVVASAAYAVDSAHDEVTGALPYEDEVIKAGGLDAWIAGIPEREAKAVAEGKRFWKLARRRERYWARKEAKSTDAA